MDSDCPGLLFYKDGEMIDKAIPAAELFGGKRMNTKTVEFVLALKKVCDWDFDAEDDPRKNLKTFNTKIKHKGQHKNEDESSSDDEKEKEYSTNQLFKYKNPNFA